MRLRYTFTLLLCLLVPSVSNAHAQSNDKDIVEVRSYRLTMDNVSRTFLTLYQLKQAAEKDPDLQKHMSAESGDDKDSQSLASITAKFSAYPTVVAIIAKNGFTPHELVVAQFAVIQAGVASAALKMGAPRDKLIADGAVSAVNLDFVQQHQAEIEELGKKYPMQ